MLETAERFSNLPRYRHHYGTSTEVDISFYLEQTHIHREGREKNHEH